MPTMNVMGHHRARLDLLALVLAGVLVGQVVAAAMAPSAQAKTRRLKLAAVGDIGPFRAQGNLIEKNIFAVLGPVAKPLAAADITFANLEAPIVTDKMKPVPARGLPILSARPSLPGNLVRAGIDVVSLANNHPFDYGYPSVLLTLKTVRAAKLPFTGLGLDKKSAEKPVILRHGGIKIGFIAATDRCNQRAPRMPNKPVVAWLRKKRLVRQVRALRPKVHIVAVSLHWGRSYSENTIGSQVKIANLLADAGADIILGHHPHVLQPVVFAKNKRTLIAYSLGNFLFGGQVGARSRTMVLTVDWELRQGERRARPVAVNFEPFVVNNRRLLKRPTKAADIAAFSRLRSRSPALGWRANR